MCTQPPPVNAMHDDGYTALMLAAKVGNMDIVKLLIDQYAADVNAAGRVGFMAQNKVKTRIMQNRRNIQKKLGGNCQCFGPNCRWPDEQH